jgi:predicted ribosome quality control (RQC) complex YloA/Tae2 family protein
VHEETLTEIVNELNELLPGHFLGRVFQLSSHSLVFDFGLKEKGYLFISVEPAAPRVYLIKRTIRELEKASVPLSSFGQAVKTTLGGGALLSLTKDEGERVVRFSLEVADDLGDTHRNVLVAQLTGRSANLFLLDAADEIKHAWRKLQGEGQQASEVYRPPVTQAKVRSLQAQQNPPITREGPETFSAAADNYYRRVAAEQQFDNVAAALIAKLKKEIARARKLQANLQKDLTAHGNPDEHKRMGDLLLANIANAERAGSKVRLHDYYAEGAPIVEVEIDENSTLQDAAGEFFSRYTKAKRAVSELGTRLRQLKSELEELDEKLVRLQRAVAERDLIALAEFEGTPKAKPVASGKKQKASLALPGMRRYRSSDGYEVLVGRTARDNDELTFRVAKPNDLWLHAGDYPGSHVIVRNSSRNDIPHRTILEAAQLAAKFSQASKDSKVSIHYTRRKFLTKPKGSAPGLVRMSSFKTVTVEPGENLERIKS